MTRSEVKTEIRQSGRQILQNMAGTAKKRVNGQDSYICPLCGNGSGSDGDGITPNPRSRNSGLKCFKCGFSGDIIDLYQQYSGADFNTALSLLAGEIGAAIGTHIPDAAVRESETNGKDMAQATQERTGRIMLH